MDPYYHSPASRSFFLTSGDGVDYTIIKTIGFAQAAEDDYLLYRKKHEEARISAAMDQEKFINVTVAQPAQTPLKPKPRGLMMRLMMAVVVGILGGVGFVFGMDMYLDRSLTTGEDIERQLGIPHIASIPEGEMAG